MEYTTWYEFKKECEKKLGHCLLNETWLKVKPKNPLPWDDTDAVSVMKTASRIKKSNPA